VARAQNYHPKTRNGQHRIVHFGAEGEHVGFTRRLTNGDASAAAKLDKITYDSAPDTNKAFMFPHDEGFYTDGWRARKIWTFGFFEGDDPANQEAALLAKVSLYVKETAAGLAAHGFPPDSLVTRVLGGKFRPQSPSAAIVAGACTHPQYRKNGIQRAALRHAFKYASEKGITDYIATAGVTNAGSLKLFFHRAGAEGVGISYHPDNPQDPMRILRVHLLGETKRAVARLDGEPWTMVPANDNGVIFLDIGHRSSDRSIEIIPKDPHFTELWNKLNDPEAPKKIVGLHWEDTTVPQDQRRHDQNETTSWQILRLHLTPVA